MTFKQMQEKVFEQLDNIQAVAALEHDSTGEQFLKEAKQTLSVIENAVMEIKAALPESEQGLEECITLNGDILFFITSHEGFNIYRTTGNAPAAFHVYLQEESPEEGFSPEFECDSLKECFENIVSYECGEDWSE